MKAIMARGAFIVFSVGILTAIIYYMLDLLTRLFEPLVMPWLGIKYLVTPLIIVFVLLLIFIVGFVFTRRILFDRLGKPISKVPIINWFFGERRIPQTINDMPGALVRFADGSYYIAALVGEQKFKNKRGDIELMYKLYCPSAPVPWSGLPIIFAKQEHVIPLKISFREVYGITTCLLYTSPSPRDRQKSRMPSSA